ncbi:carboxymuconolactone decarboxylase family protein [Streptomyces sp. NPDC054804]
MPKQYAPIELQAIAPKLVEVTNEVLFGDVWERPGLSPRDRSLVTVSALAALYRSEQLPYHLGVALENGLTVEELSEAITHLAFYVGWPNAMTAINHLKKLTEERDA